jgi:hypothetical protein
LRPALLALANLFQEANDVVSPSSPPVSLEIKATGRGSFNVDLILRLADDAVDMFSSDPVTAVVNLRELVIGSTVGLFALIKRLRGRHVAARNPVPDGVQLVLEDGTTLIVPAATDRLAQNVTVRHRTRQVMEPLLKEGITDLRFETETETTVTIERADLPSVDALEPSPLTMLSVTEVQMTVEIASASFTEGTKWRLSDGARTFYAAMEDPAFQQRIDAGEPFRRKDLLTAQVRIAQYEDTRGLHTDYTVLHVLAHTPATDRLGIQTELELAPDAHPVQELPPQTPPTRELGPPQDEDEPTRVTLRRLSVGGSFCSSRRSWNSGASPGRRVADAPPPRRRRAGGLGGGCRSAEPRGFSGVRRALQAATADSAFGQLDGGFGQVRLGGQTLETVSRLQAHSPSYPHLPGVLWPNGLRAHDITGATRQHCPRPARPLDAGSQPARSRSGTPARRSRRQQRTRSAPACRRDDNRPTCEGRVKRHAWWQVLPLGNR